MLLRKIIQGDFVRLANGRRQLVSRGAGLLIGQREQQRGAQGFPHLFERLGVSRLLLQHLDDMEAVLRMNQVGNLARAEVEGRLFKLRHGLFLDDPAQVATLILCPRVFGVFFR